MTVARMPHWFTHEANKLYKCTVRYLDDSSWETTYSKSEDSQKLFDRICDHLNLIEKDYFGLRFVDDKKQRRWLDLGKNARKQLKKAGKDLDSVIVCFRVKFYPPDPVLRVHEELTHYQLFLQLRRDLQHGRLYGSSGDEALLVACILQSELGDKTSSNASVPDDYRCLMKHGKKGEAKALDQWNVLRGLSPSDCEKRFIEQAARLDTFGIDPHPVKNDENQQVFLGYNHFGIIAFLGSKKIMHLDWAHILKMSYEGRTFLVHYVRESKKNTRGLKCSTGKAAKHLWRNALETKIFFTAPTSKNLSAISNGSTIFSRASRVRFSGHVAREAMEQSLNLHRPNVSFQRAAFVQKPDTEVYEGVVATPALHRRASLFPIPKGDLPPELDGAAGDSVKVPPEIPAFKDVVPAEPHSQVPPSPASDFQTELTSTRVETPTDPILPSEPLKPPRLADRTVTERTLQKMRDRLEDNIDEITTKNGNYPLSQESLEMNSIPPSSVFQSRENSVLQTVAVVALISGTALLGIYTLFETNWLSTGITDIFEPLKTAIYVPLKEWMFGAETASGAMISVDQSPAIAVEGPADVLV